MNPVNLLLMLVNSGLWLWYAIFFPVPPLVLSNTVGLTACCYYLASCWFYASQRREQMWGVATAASTLLAFGAIFLALVYAASSFTRAQQVGNMAMAVNVLTYGAPLSVVSRVVTEKCSSPLPPAQCFLTLSCSFLWLCVGLAWNCMPMIIPNALGVLLALLQLSLLWLYPRTLPLKSHADLGKTLLARPYPGTKHIELPLSLHPGKKGIEEVNDNLMPRPASALEAQYLQSLHPSYSWYGDSRNGNNSSKVRKPIFLVGICTDAE